mgnify:CR=1 FL=1
MFKRGGSSFQAQGTGITSPYDTPRKNYKVGTTWEEIQERRSNIYQPRGEMSFAAEGFSALGNPYRESGEAKTIGEMLYEGAGQVRKSRAADKALGQSVDLANIESDAARLSLEEKFERDMKLRAQDLKIHELKPEPWGRRVMKTAKGLRDSYTLENPYYDFVNLYSISMAVGEETISDLQKNSDAIIRAAVLEPHHYTLDEETGTYEYSIKNLVPGMIYFEPTEKRWFYVDYTGEQPVPVYKSSYDEADLALKALGEDKPNASDEKTNKLKKTNTSGKEIKNNEIKMKITSNLKGVELTDDVVFDEAAKIGIKIVSPDGTKTWSKNLAENEMSFPAFKKILEKKKLGDTYAHVKGKTFRNKGNNVFDETEKIQLTEDITKKFYDTGGIVEPDPDVDEMNELASWWKSEVNKSFDS